MVAESTKRLEALGLSPDRMERVVTVASLIEGEAKNEADRSKVARVVENRLAAKMSLGFDSTVNYIFKKRGVPTQAMLDSKSPYNTRRLPGLPPGPISNPGESALRAAANPVAGPWLYFVTVNLDTGETKFAATYEAHQRQRGAVPEVVHRQQGQVLSEGRGGARHCAVWGSPIRHSLSPVLHRAAHAALGLGDWSYDRREVDEAGFAGRLRRARRDVARAVADDAAQGGRATGGRQR